MSARPLTWVVGYGSLVYPPSLAATVGAPLGDPVPVTLAGWRRAWNVAAPTDERPDRVFVGEDGEPWTGHVVFLGIEEADDGAPPLPALAHPVDDAQLAALDARERGYDRVDVSGSVVTASGAALEGPVVTYVPHPEAVATARTVRGVGVVTARYLRLVDQGYRALGDATYAAHLAELPDPREHFVVGELTERATDGSAAHTLVDPAGAAGPHGSSV